MMVSFLSSPIILYAYIILFYAVLPISVLYSPVALYLSLANAL